MGPKIGGHDRVGRSVMPVPGADAAGAHGWDRDVPVGVRDLRYPGWPIWGTMRLLMRTVTTPLPRSEATRERLHLGVLVGVHDGTLSGVNTYVEHVAAAAATAVENVTLLVAHDGLAADVGRRLEGTGIRIISLGMDPIGARQRRLERLSPGYAARRLTAALGAARSRIGGGFDAAHLNHPHLAATFRPLASKVFVAAWFYPHSVSGRVSGTWRHSGGRFPRSALLALKGVSHYRNDTRGYRDADLAVAPTHALVSQLRRAGIEAVQCTPPARVLACHPSGEDVVDRPVPRLLVCSGDLAHPRKNVRLALGAVAHLGAGGRRVQLELVGGNASPLRDALDHLPQGVEVTLTGRLPAAIVHDRMRQADVLLFPSLFEEWGYVAAEAALQGTPVVTLPVYPFAEMLAAPYGFTASDATVSAYASAVAAALDGAVARGEVAEAAERRFGLDGAGQRLAVIWSGEASGRRPSLASG